MNVIKYDDVLKLEPFTTRCDLGWITSGSVNYFEDKTSGIQLNNKELQRGNLLQQFGTFDSATVVNSLYKEDHKCVDRLNVTVSEIIYFDSEWNFHFHLRDFDYFAIRGLLIKLRMQSFRANSYLWRVLKNHVWVSGAYHMKSVNNSVPKLFHRFYDSHISVITESITTTKFRLGFKSSVNSSSGLSLNDIFRVEPYIKEELISILMMFFYY